MKKIKIQIKFLKKQPWKIILILPPILTARQSNRRKLPFFRKFSQRLSLSISKSAIIHRLKSKKKKKESQKNNRMLKK